MNQGQQPQYHHQQQVSDEYDRRSRFTSGVDTPRSASQPPRTHGDNFLSSPLLANYGSTSPILGGMTGAPWARAPRMPSVPRSPSIGLPSSVPTRSSSFSVDRIHQNSFSAAMRESHSFASTFEDDESEAMSDTQQDFMSSRGRPQLSDMARSRSQSLAAVRPAPMPIGTSVSQRGYSDMSSSLHQAYSSGPLSIPNASEVRYGEIKSPGAGSRYGSLGGMARSPMNVHASSPTGLRVGYGGDGIGGTGGRAEISNISPFVRDVGQIFDDYVWGSAAPPNDHGGLASGTTSRRHSVSIVQPRRGVVGFNAPGGNAIGEDELLSGSSATVGANSGGLLLSDDDLAADLLNLNLGQTRAGNNNNINSSLPPSQPSSLPIYPPPHGHGHGYGAGIGSGLHSQHSPSPDKLQEAKEELFAGVKVRQMRGPSANEGAVSSGGGSGSGSSPMDHPQPSHRVESTFTPAFSRPRPAQIQTGFDASMGARFTPGQAAHNLTSSSQISPSHTRTQFSPATGKNLDPNAITPSNPFGMFGITQRKEVAPNFFDINYNPNPPPELPPDHWYRLLTKRLKTDDVRSMTDLGKGIPLHAIPRDCPLYIVEFKAGRTDLFFTRDNSMELHTGDLVIVEADRGRDLGKIVNDTISFAEVMEFQKQQQHMQGGFGFGGEGSGGHGGPTSPDTPTASAAAKKEKEISPKRILGRATPQDEQILEAKTQDELKALQLCQSKVRQKKLPMEVFDAEYQWDRRKLTFYFIAEKRIDFRELVRELFRLYKTRIWMAALQGSAPADQ